MKKNRPYRKLKSIIPMQFVLSFLFISLYADTIAQPVINSFTPASGAIGTTVTINGSGFDAGIANNIVFFGATKATVTAASATTLTATVPAGASFHPLSILNTTNNLTGYSSNPFYITFNNGDGQPILSSSFNSAVNFTGGTNPFSIVAVNDIDGDGKPDMVVSNEYSNTFSVFKNISAKGNITASSFAPKVDFVTDSTPAYIAIGDIDGDGKPDIVIANEFTNTISIFRNTSASGSITTASFAPGVDFITDTLSLPSSIAIGDIDGDGKPDLVVTNPYNNTISVLKNNSSPGNITASSFAAPVDFIAGSGPNFVAIADIDGDGKADLVIANYNGKTVSVLKNTSTPGSITTSSFASHLDFATNTGPYSLAVADINNDGRTDIIAANQGSNNVSVLINNSTPGNIAFAAKNDFSSGGNSPFSVAAGNLDGDALPDIVVSNATTNNISILQNTFSSGAGASFNTGVSLNTGYYPFSAFVSDLDSDGEADIAVPVDGNNIISVFKNILPNSTVPVSLLTFTGTYQNTGNALLNWQTTYEINASYFNIQRSVDGVNFTTINKVNAIGNSTFANNYNYTDSTISLLDESKIFYRLQEIDKNGATTYSNIITITLGEKTNRVTLFPNPAYSNIIVSHPATTNNAQIQITTMEGKSVFKKDISYGSDQTLLNVSLLSKGTYILIFNDADYRTVLKFVKL